MAKEDTAGEQLELIDVDDPNLKEVKREILGYDKLLTANREQHASDREAEKRKREKVLAAIEATGIQPEADGSYHMVLDGKEWVLFQDSQLKIKKHKAPKTDYVPESA